MFSRFCYVIAKTVVSPELVEVPRAGGAPLPGACFGIAGEAQMDSKVREEGNVHSVSSACECRDDASSAAAPCQAQQQGDRLICTVPRPRHAFRAAVSLRFSES
jgi:hypothetical protein